MADLYRKLTLAAFKERVAGGFYRGVVGARRALGKVQDWSEKEKKEARALIEQHYAEGKASTPASPPRPPAKRTKGVSVEAQPVAPSAAVRPSQLTNAELIQFAGVLRELVDTMAKSVAAVPEGKDEYLRAMKICNSVMTVVAERVQGRHAAPSGAEPRGRGQAVAPQRFVPTRMRAAG